ncbi:uncharacterized protein PGTG_21689 [Puccinia graminis f. sp. tritici CRL 75-36-700-3]|uniref:No apical meristem-associated C-terminal domain-containing protein n=1 Tax=Puccinia graminis f. sp. tritici (strain CRL 75-36-700-3 / race SCCL) TaxID=418459 RepID=H6QS40_PUCGT|nr:uncharacterized protein PGTG_21689 [Puccinia graminis f. sp. tritici CRL 75-36-700-3]EHS63513.1 hypothetical protein PGTG_21689 [Puccinia graminis f. sp. tritici CRL 75-36-700-3]
MPPKRVVVDPLLMEINQTTPTATTRTMRTAHPDPHATPTGLVPAITPLMPSHPDSHTTPVPQPAPSTEIIKDTNEAPKKKAPKWTINEDKQLCAAWLNTSRDSIVGTGQKAGTFWEWVHQLYTDLVVDYNKENKNSKTIKPLPVRLVNAVECRWGHIMRVCNKFGGCYLQVERQMRSGMSRDDILSEAKELYKSENESTFNLDHCWGILREHPKWQATQQEIDLRQKKTKEPPSSTPATDEALPSSPQTTTQPDDEDDRSALGSEAQPEGNKAAKRKRDDDAILQKIIKTQEELVKISKERSASVQKALEEALEAKKVEADDRIMAMDLTGMDDEAKLYWQKKQRAILD